LHAVRTARQSLYVTGPGARHAATVTSTGRSFHDPFHGSCAVRASFRRCAARELEPRTPRIQSRARAVIWEQFDIVLSGDVLPAAEPLICALRDPDVQSSIHTLGGYDLSRAGSVEILT
jgi:hypothetical protein